MGNFEVGIFDFVDLEWLFNDSIVVVWDFFFEYKVCIDCCILCIFNFFFVFVYMNICFVVLFFVYC